MTRVPGNVIDGRSLPFPAGTYIGKLSEAKNEWYASDRKNNPDKKDGVRLVLTFKEITPVEGPNVGARPMIQRIDVVVPPKNGRDAISLVDVTEFDDSIPFNLRQSATLLSQLALAWGAITRDADGSSDVDFDQFIASLEGGVFNGREVMFGVEQRQVESKTGSLPSRPSPVSVPSRARRKRRPLRPLRQRSLAACVPAPRT
jgi:hypothetical protein